MLCQFQVNAYNTGIGTTVPAASTATMSRGATVLAAGTSSGTVALGLAYVPTTVILTMQGPDSNALTIVPSLAGAPVAASFNFELSAGTDRAGYVLHWMVLQ
jgi:hypothetical protein